MSRLKDKTIIFIASVPWQYNWQRQHEWSSRLATSNKVIYVQPLGMNNIGPLKLIKKIFERKSKGIYKHKLEPVVARNIIFMRPFFIPWHNIKIMNWLNGWLLSRQVNKLIVTPKSELIFWACNPADTVSSLIKRYPGSTVVYDIAMRFLKRADCPKYLKAAQDRLAERADIILSDSLASAGDLPTATQKKLSYIPQGVNQKMFRPLKHYQNKLDNIPEPRIIYLGADHDSIDRDIYRAILSQLPDAHLILTYANNPADPQDQNVHHIGPVQFLEIPNLLREVQLGIIPYEVNQYTCGVFPTKMFEYLAAGLPVVSSALPELKQFSDKILIARSAEHFAKLIRQGLKTPIKPDDNFIKEQTWRHRFEDVTKKLLQALAAKGT